MIIRRGDVGVDSLEIHSGMTATNLHPTCALLGGLICFRRGTAPSCPIICHYGFQELILSSTQCRSCETALSKRRLLCLSVRYLGTMRARTLRYPSPSWRASCTFPMDNCNATGNFRIPLVGLTNYVLSMVSHSHPFCMSWADRRDRHHACPSGHFHALRTIFWSGALSSRQHPAPVTCRWILMGQTCFAYTNRITLRTTNIVTNAHQVIPWIATEWFLCHVSRYHR